MKRKTPRVAQPDLNMLRRLAKAQGLEIDLSTGQLELFLLTDPEGVTFATSWPATDVRAEQEARQWLERYGQE